MAVEDPLEHGCTAEATEGRQTAPGGHVSTIEGVALLIAVSTPLVVSLAHLRARRDRTRP